ncbi:MAG: carbohydrate-binding domain-containing protein [Deltaproteobacteria bacterium]|nr:carbohydrate-binding domain-containing protein [Deltaproteobacteria bacterium]
MKRNFILALVICLFCWSCGGGGGGTSSGSGSGAPSDTGPIPTAISDTPYAVSVAATQDTAHYKAEDIVGNNTFDYTINIDFTNQTAQLSGGSVLDYSSGSVTPVTGVTVGNSTYGVTVTSTIAAKVRYNLTGGLNGTLTVNSSGEYQLYLNGVEIRAEDGPALDLESSQKVFIVSASGTANTLADSDNRILTMKASVYGKGAMIFSGDGTISVTGSYKHGIFSNDYIRVNGGTLNVTVGTKDAVRSVNAFIFDDGNLTINATGTTTDDESKGIKVEGKEGSGVGKGYIVINGGHITVHSTGKAITAGWDIDEDATTVDTSDDPNPDVIVNNGIINITTTVVPYENASGSCSPEGIEAKSDLTINNGYFVINSTDDVLNAGSSITINNGYIYGRSTYADAFDSNGPMTINGGVIVAIGTIGSGGQESSFDSDGTFTINGGILVGIAANTRQPAVNQNTVVLGSLTSGTTMALWSNDGTTAFAFTIPQDYETLIISSPDIASGKTYKVYTGGTAYADNIFNNCLYIGNLGYNGGTAGSSLTTTSGVGITKIGGEYFP